MLTREQKTIQIEELSDKLSKAKSVVITSYRGLKINDMNELRKNLRKNNIDFKVVKNSLFKRALQRYGKSISQELLEKPLAVAFDDNDDMTAIKAIYSFSKNNELLEIDGGIFENEMLDGQGIKEIALLPGREELYAKLVGSISAPISKFVYAMRWNGQALTSVLKQYLENK